MDKPIYPRSPRERMDGWMHLPRYVDKIRLHLANKLHADYQPNLGKGFDGLWLETAGVTHEQMLAVVRDSLIDGQVCDWVRENVRVPGEAKEKHAETMLNRPGQDPAGLERLKLRKAEAGLSDRDDIRSFVDFIDADEGRL